MNSVVKALDDPSVSLATCGGKGENLGRLIRAGFPVPPGFVVVTDTYRRFIEANALGPIIDAACQDLSIDNPRSVDAASARIQAAFTGGVVPDDMATAIRTGLDGHFTPRTALAVRSSATSEDLPEMSFAGQQDTFLNIVGADATVRAIVACWGSLWTARAIGYRLRGKIPQDAVAIAVVVQAMAPTESSGVLFTANPLTGRREEVVIDATIGLGEALVSGQVEPDHFVVNSRTGRVDRTLGAKAVMTVAKAGGGVETATTPPYMRAAISDAQARNLAELGRAVAAEFGSPQDIEWTIADGRIHLVQARPITSLYPIPLGDSEALWASFGAIQGMLQPITPLGRDALNLLLSGASEVTGFHTDLAAAGYLASSGERLWIRCDRMLRHSWGSRYLKTILPHVEPSLAAIAAQLASEFSIARQRPTLRQVRALLRTALSVLPQVPMALACPDRARQRLDAVADKLVLEASRLQTEATAREEPWERLAARTKAMRSNLHGLGTVLRSFAPVMIPGLALLASLETSAAKKTKQARTLSLEILRSLPGNVTSEMDLHLWRVAQTIQADADATALFQAETPEMLACRYAAGTLPRPAQAALASFLERYGMRGVAEIDLGQPRWKEEPADVVRMLRAYLTITDSASAPDAVFDKGKLTADQASRHLITVLASGRRLGRRVTAARVKFMTSRIRLLLGARETPKFTLVRLLGCVREGLLASGRDLVNVGVLEQADDVFYLRLDELERLTQEEAGPWRAVVASRRRLGEREQRRGQVPRALAGDGRAFYAGLGHADGGLGGSPVSPGTVEGTVRVVFDPQAAQLQPGEILVCPGTDPAWTPLFLIASGLVTEVGGMMTHGSVVAREYGIPAVVGVHEATSHLKTGQRIRLNGSTGSIEILTVEG